MTISSSDQNKQPGQQQQQPQRDSAAHGHSGEGAASALAHMKKQTRQERHPAGDDDRSVVVRH